ncbi:MAG: hypothetical protein JKY37_17320 [Nannocystaceae bacterium]|nr:hypothetical protein [Nannocystaceae bacterium]
MALTASACDAPERTERAPTAALPGPKSDEPQDGKPGPDEDAPFFVQPDESEVTVSLNSGLCVEIAMTLSDDAERLEIDVDAPPEIQGATLTKDANGFSAHWRWCPGAFGEAPAPGSYEVMLIADDGTHLPTAKPYTIIVDDSEPQAEPEDKPEDEPPPFEDCSEGWPSIDYQPANVADDVATISALFKDDAGIVGFPKLVVAFEAPGEQLPETTEYAMALVDGDHTAGLWLVDVPMGGQTLYYRYVAQDALPGETCAHILEEPAEAFLEVTP